VKVIYLVLWLCICFFQIKFFALHLLEVLERKPSLPINYWSHTGAVFHSSNRCGVGSSRDRLVSAFTRVHSWGTVAW